MSHCWKQKGKNPTKTGWADTNKGTSECPDNRSRWVAIFFWKKRLKADITETYSHNPTRCSLPRVVCQELRKGRRSPSCLTPRVALTQLDQRLRKGDCACSPEHPRPPAFPSKCG